MSASNKKAQRIALVLSIVGALVAMLLIVLTTSSDERRDNDYGKVLGTSGVEDGGYGEVPEFNLRDQGGLPFGKARLLGTISIADFIFTRCRTVCPVITMKMQGVAKKTSADVQLLSFSVDPEYDTPERLAAYAQKHNIDGKRWHFLTGDSAEIEKTVQGALKISMELEDVDEEGIPNIVHGSHFVLFDEAGRIRGYYNPEDESRMASLVTDANRLAKNLAKQQRQN